MTSRLSILYILAGMMFAAALGMAFKSSDGLTPAMERIYNVKEYGAIGNGIADDTAAIQAASNAADANNGGTVFIPNGTYKITGTNGIILGLTNSAQHYVSLRGESVIKTVLSYAGPTNGTCIVVNSSKNVTIENFTISRSGDQGTTTGMLLSGVGGGTQSSGGTIRNVIITGLYLCIDGGPRSPYTGTSSEWIFDSLLFQSAEKGFSNHDFNGLNFLFRMLQASQVTTVIDGQTAGITVDGGSFSFCGTGMYCRNGGLFSIKNVRAEVQEGPFVDMAGTTVIMENCQIDYAPDSATNNAIALNGGSARIISSQIGGKIQAPLIGTLTIEDSGISDSVPANVTTQTGSTYFLRNYQINNGSAAVVSRFTDSIVQPP